MFFCPESDFAQFVWTFLSSKYQAEKGRHLVVSDVILYLHVLSNLKLDKNTSIPVALFIGKVEGTKQQ